ncbi:gas vesicle protein [Uniformispora flossi]|uniref:gas vesicle protein GvpO n=1 Tax=Uniformispora flossi TaxID=3390723 RepID=UPI003C2BCEA1
MAEQTPRRTKSGSSARKSRAAASGVGAKDAARLAHEYVDALVDRPVDGVSGLRRTDDGWEISIDVVEVPRIPDTTSLLATYRLRLDKRGELVGYDRVARFRRSDTSG